MSARSDTVSRVVKAAAPSVLGLFGVILLSIPIRIAEGFAPTPLLPLIVVYFWSIYGPEYLPAPTVFAIGLMQDLLTGGPVGLWPLIYLLVQFALVNQRAYFLGREQKVVWVGFAVAALVAGAILWGATSLVRGEAMPLAGLAARLGATVAIFPLFAAAFAHVHRRVILQG